MGVRIRLLLHLFKLAERVGFEPTERFPVHSISSAANSTTLAPLLEEFQISGCGFRNFNTINPAPSCGV